MIRSFFYALICFFALILPAAAQDTSAIQNFFESDNYVDGKRAYDKGDYATALKFWRETADQGEGPAQYFVGAMYHAGHGVEKDYKLAMEWYTKAAVQDIHNAQLAIGGMFADGHGVEKNYVTARMWFILAEIYGSERAIPFLKKLDTRMTPEEIARSKKMALDWINNNKIKK